MLSYVPYMCREQVGRRACVRALLLPPAFQIVQYSLRLKQNLFSVLQSDLAG